MTVTLNELGRNSASVTYGPTSNGSDLFPTLQATDAWFRNDTWQGTATASSATLTGSGSVWSTQARAGDYIMVAGQQRIVAGSPAITDTSLPVTVGFNPAITVPSAVKAINGAQPTQTQGYVSTIVRGSTSGVVSVTNNSQTITGVGTYFLAEATNSVTTVAMTGTVAIDTTGSITGTSTLFQSQQTNTNGLFPGDSIAVTQPNGAVYYFIIATVSGDNGAACATVVNPPTIAIPSLSTIAKATNGVAGRQININGRIRTILSITSNTVMTVNYPMDFTDSNLRYKVYPRGTITNTSAAGGTLYGASAATSTGTTSLTLTTLTTNAVAVPGMYIIAPPGTGTATTNVPAGTYIVNQQYAASGVTINNTSVAGTSGTNVLTTSGAQTGTITVGMLVTGNGAAISGVPAGTYVVGITGTSPNFTITVSQNLTGTVSGTVYFIAGGGAGVYTTNQITTITATALQFSSVTTTGVHWFWDLGDNNLNSTTNTPYMYQTSVLDQIWIGDEVRTINFSSFGGGLTGTTSTSIGYTTDYVGYSGTAIHILRQQVFGIPFRREDSYINGTAYGATQATFLADLRVGDELIIDGTEVTVSQVVSNTQFKISSDFTHTTANNSNGAVTVARTFSSGGAPGASTVVLDASTSVAVGQFITGVGLQEGAYVTAISQSPTPNTITVSSAFTIQAVGTYNLYNGVNFYKKLKLHGYTLEGTREGGVGITTGTAQAVVGSGASASTTSLTISVAPTPTNSILPGQQVLPAVISGANIGGLTYITNQQLGTGASITFTTSGAATQGTNVITFSANPSTVVVGMLIQNATSTAFSYAPLGTYVTAVNNTTNQVTLSNALTTTIPTSTALYFVQPGNVGIYTTNVSTTTIAAVNMYTPLTGKFTQATSILATNGTSYPAGTTTLTLAANPTIGQYNFIKISGAGGPPQVLTGQVSSYVATLVNGINTQFTTQLHIGAEIIVGGQYLTVVAINSDTQLVVAQNAYGATQVVFGPTPIYRSVPLYTYITSVNGAVITIATPLKNNLYTGVVNPPQVYLPSTGADFLEYVYSAPNYSVDTAATTTIANQSLDRKYVGFRIWPLYQNINAGVTATVTIAAAQGAYATPVYERWAASYAQTQGVGVNQADLSGGTMVWGTIGAATVLSVTMPVCGSLTTQMAIQGLASGIPNPVSVPVSFNSNTQGLSNVTYTIGTSPTQATPFPIVASLFGVYDINAMTQLSGGTLFLFGNKRYFAIQGRSAANVQSQWMGCIEFERAQPEDASTGLGSTSGITFGGTFYGGSQMAQGAAIPTVAAPGFNQSIQYTVGTAPYPTFAYFNGNRLPTGSSQTPTLPQVTTTANVPIHGCVLACPRIRNAAGDLVGFNANIYSALTITTGRWGHMIEFGAYGTYNPSYLGTTFTPSGGILTLTANTIPQVHMGQIVPVYTNIYNSKRFMFSPVVVLGPAYDPDVRGRLYGLKVLPSALGTLMDTVSITVDPNYFYNTAYSTATDHWVISTPPSTTLNAAYPGQQIVQTQRFTLTANASSIQQSWRSLEDTSSQASNATSVLFTNNFRFALPA